MGVLTGVCEPEGFKMNIAAYLTLSLACWFGMWWALKLEQIHFGRVALGIFLWLVSDSFFEAAKKAWGLW